METYQEQIDGLKAGIIALLKTPETNLVECVVTDYTDLLTAAELDLKKLEDMRQNMIGITEDVIIDYYEEVGTLGCVTNCLKITKAVYDLLNLYSLLEG